jgi:hypothetical protein
MADRTQAPRAWLWGLLGAAALGGCADLFIGDPPPSAERWRGTTTAGPAVIDGCAPLAVDVAIYQDPFSLSRVVDGRAEPTTEVTGFLPRATDAVTTWWIQGDVSRTNVVQFESGRQRPVYFRAKPYALWRGVLEGDRATLVESGSPCNRELVLTRG